MRFYDILIFVLIFNFSMALVNNLNLFGLVNTPLEINGQDANSYALNQYQGLNTSIGTVENSAVSTQATFSWFNAAYQFIIVLIPTTIKVFADTTVLFPILLYNMLAGFGIPSAAAAIIVVPISSIMYIVELLAILQFATGRSFREST